MQIKNVEAIDYIYKPASEGRAISWVAFGTEEDCWRWLKGETSFGLECEYYYTKPQLRKKGYSVIRYKLVPA